MRQSFKYRWYPNKTQQPIIDETLEPGRVLDNRLLAERQAAYAKCGHTLTYVKRLLRTLLERFCDLLDGYDERAVIFGNYEKGEVGRAVTDFSGVQARGVTRDRGRSLDRLVDTLYFTKWPRTYEC